MPRQDSHPARAVQNPLPVVFTAHSRHTFFMRQHIIKFVLDRGRVPINPFASFEYFMLDTVPRDAVRQANNTLMQKADELWTFGVIADGVYEEIRLARLIGMPVRHFSLGGDRASIGEIGVADLEYEDGVPVVRDMVI